MLRVVANKNVSSRRSWSLIGRWTKNALVFVPRAARKASRENKQKLRSRETYAEVRLSRANARPYVYAKVLSKRRLSHRPFPEDIGIYIR